MLSKFCSVKGHWLFCIQLFCIQLVKVDWYPTKFGKGMTMGTEKLDTQPRVCKQAAV